MAVAQAIFANILVARLAADTPGVDAEALLLAVSGVMRSIVPPASLPAVLGAFERAIISTLVYPLGSRLPPSSSS